MIDQITLDACYLWSVNILGHLEQAGLITAAELDRIRRLSEQHYRPSLILL
jgi:hypothetical protein